MSVWVCASCDHEYNSDVGDLANGVAPGTALEDLPQDWTCPDCGASKLEFAPLAGSSRDGSGWTTANS